MPVTQAATVPAAQMGTFATEMIAGCAPSVQVPPTALQAPSECTLTQLVSVSVTAVRSGQERGARPVIRSSSKQDAPPARLVATTIPHAIYVKRIAVVMVLLRYRRTTVSAPVQTGGPEPTAGLAPFRTVGRTAISVPLDILATPPPARSAQTAAPLPPTVLYQTPRGTSAHVRASLDTRAPRAVSAPRTTSLSPVFANPAPSLPAVALHTPSLRFQPVVLPESARVRAGTRGLARTAVPARRISRRVRELTPSGTRRSTPRAPPVMAAKSSSQRRCP